MSQSNEKRSFKGPHSDQNFAKIEVDTFAQENAPIKRVVLYKHGIALFERWESILNFVTLFLDQDYVEDKSISLTECPYLIIFILIL